ncbi:hypothetical protein BV22DRAFT_1028015 [Leucogyrophana mollusca]|uniref:Uncharacterized protein n=1 Tax=Leucogyrophana mollusca TaxID=85980 RepID=A0ACB8C182_9AGAM|nr:hypothetical protein BV22DRAFT_1028015 [Leucogyrophana mollusca]
MCQNTRAQLRKSRSVSLYLPRRPDSIPIPPSLVNSPHLLNPESIFRKKIRFPKSPLREDDEWLRDLIPLVSSSGRREGKGNQVDEDEKWGPLRLTPSNTSDATSHQAVPPSPILRPWSSPPTPFYVSVDNRSITSGMSSSKVGA